MQRNRDFVIGCTLLMMMFSSAQAATKNLGSDGVAGVDGSTTGNPISGWIRSDAPDASAGGNLNIFVGGITNGGVLRGFLGFDLSSFTTSDTINSAVLSLYHGTNNIFDSTDRPGESANPTNVTLEIVETAQALADNATWNTYDGTNPWTTAGGDFGAAIASTVANRDTIDADDEVQFDITSAVQSAVSAGQQSLNLLVTAPSLEAAAGVTRDFFVFDGYGIGGDAGSDIGPNLFIEGDFLVFNPADVNQDGSVNSLDFQQISGDLFKAAADLVGVNQNSDIDGSGLVDFSDFRLWKNTPQGALAFAAMQVPEPTTLALISGGLLALVAARRRS